MAPAPKTAKGLPGNVWLLGFVSFFNDVSSEMLVPVLPILLTQVLGAPVAVVGLIEGCAEGAASVLKGVFGRISDRSGKRKPFVVWGYACSALSKAVIALSGIWGVVFAGRLLDRFGKGLRTGARDALLLDASTERNRGLVFGFHRAMDSFGAVTGPLLALLLLRVFSGNIRPILWVALIPASLGLLLFVFLKEKPAAPAAARPKQALASWKTLSPGFRAMLLALAVFSLGNSTDAFLILRAKGLGLGLEQVILAYALYNLVYAVLSVPAGSLSDRIGPKRVMIAGVLVYAVVYACFAFAAAPLAAWVLFPVYGAYIAFTDGVSKAWASTFIRKDSAAGAYGTLQAVTGLCTLLASLIGGVLWTAFSPAVTFLFAVSCALASLPLFLRVPGQAAEARAA